MAWAAATCASALAIMKDSRIGAFGAIGLIVLMGLKRSALVALPAAAFSLIVVAAHVVSRWCSIGLVWALRYARAEGDGKSREFDGGLAADGKATARCGLSLARLSESCGVSHA